MRFQQLPDVPAMDLSLALGLDNVCWCEIATGKIVFCAISADLTGGSVYTGYFCMAIYNEQEEKWEFSRWCQILFSGSFNIGPSRKMYPTMQYVVSKNNTAQGNLILHVAHMHAVVRMFEMSDGDWGFTQTAVLFPTVADWLGDIQGNRHTDSIRPWAYNGIYYITDRLNNPRWLETRGTVTAEGAYADATNLLDTSSSPWSILRTIYNFKTLSPWYSVRVVIGSYSTNYGNQLEAFYFANATTVPTRYSVATANWPNLVNAGFQQGQYYGWAVTEDNCRIKLSYTANSYAVCSTSDWSNAPSIYTLDAEVPGPVLHTLILGNHRNVALINDDSVNRVITATNANADFSLNQTERTSLKLAVWEWDTTTKKIKSWTDPIEIDTKNGYTKHAGCYWSMFRLANDKFVFINPKWADPEKTGTDKLTLGIQTYQIQ